MPLQDLTNRAIEVKQESVEQNNDAYRIGKLFEDIISFFDLNVTSATAAALITEISARNTAISTAINTLKQELIGGAPDAFNAFNELAAALNNDANFATNIFTLLAGKATNESLSAEILARNKAIADLEKELNDLQLRGNLFQNSDFSDGITGWNINYDPAIEIKPEVDFYDNPKNPEGARALQIVTHGANNGIWYQWAEELEKKYTITFWVKAGTIPFTLWYGNESDSRTETITDRNWKKLIVEINPLTSDDGHNIVFYTPTPGIYFIAAPRLMAGTGLNPRLKTINNQSLFGSGNIIIDTADLAPINNAAFTGNTTMKALTPNSTLNSNNITIGNGVLADNEHNPADSLSGNYNVGIGTFSQNKNKTAKFNVSYGCFSLMDNLFCNSLSAFGHQALSTLNAGNGHVIGIGCFSGIGYNLSKSVYLGDNTRGTEGSTNEIVIGNNVQGAGSNKTVIGNNNTIQTILKGEVTGNKFTAAASIEGNDLVIKGFESSISPTGIAEANPQDGSIYGNNTNFDKYNIDDIFFGYDSNDDEILSSPIASIIDNEYIVLREQFTYGGELASWYIQRSNANKANKLEIFGSNDKGNTENKTVFNGSLFPAFGNIYNVGAPSKLWNQIYAANTSISTSDARLKTEIVPFTPDELNASKQLSKEVGTYKFLSAIAEKGDAARLHIGLTVQKAIEIMQANNLNPFAYGFICRDEWEDQFVEVPEVVGVEHKDAWTEEIKDPDGNVINTIEHAEIEEVKAVPAYTKQVQKAGDLFSFRYTELLAFICRGFEERLTLLESAN